MIRIRIFYKESFVVGCNFVRIFYLVKVHEKKYVRRYSEKRVLTETYVKLFELKVIE